MLFFLILLSDSLDYYLYDYMEPVDVNTASREALLSIPLLNVSEVDSLLKYRPFGSFDEIAHLLGFSDIEMRVLRRYMLISEIRKNEKSIPEKPTLSFWLTSWVDTAFRAGIRYFVRGSWRGWRGSLRGRGDTLSFILSGHGFHVGNFRISFAGGLLGSSYLVSSSGLSVRRAKSLSVMLDRYGFVGFADTSGDFLLFYRRKAGGSHVWMGVVGRGRAFFYGGLNAGLLGGEMVFRDGVAGYSYFIRFSGRNVYVKFSYRNVEESFWMYSDTGRYFSIYSRVRMGPFTLRGYLSSRYFYQALSYRISATSSLDFRVSSSSYRVGFGNSEPMDVSWIHGRCGDALSIFYRFLRVIYYDTDCSMYVYGGYVPLAGSGMYVKGRGVAYALLLKWRRLRFRYMGGKFTLSFGHTF